jgi:hypothetical protein
VRAHPSPDWKVNKNNLETVAEFLAADVSSSSSHGVMHHDGPLCRLNPSRRQDRDRAGLMAWHQNRMLTNSQCNASADGSDWYRDSAATIPARAGLTSSLRSGLELLSKALLDHHQTDPGRFQQMQQSTAARQPETAGQALATGGIASRYPANAGRPSEPGVPDQSGEADVTRIGNVPRWEGEGSRT